MSDTTTEFKVGDRVRVAAEAEDVYFGGEVEGVVVPDDGGPSYPEGEHRVLVEAWSPAWDGRLQQWVKPKDLALINN